MYQFKRKLVVTRCLRKHTIPVSFTREAVSGLRLSPRNKIKARVVLLSLYLIIYNRCCSEMRAHVCSQL